MAPDGEWLLALERAAVRAMHGRCKHADGNRSGSDHENPSASAPLSSGTALDAIAPS